MTEIYVFFHITLLSFKIWLIYPEWPLCKITLDYIFSFANQRLTIVFNQTNFHIKSTFCIYLKQICKPWMSSTSTNDCFHVSIVLSTITTALSPRKKESIKCVSKRQQQIKRVCVCCHLPDFVLLRHFQELKWFHVPFSLSLPSSSTPALLTGHHLDPHHRFASKAISCRSSASVSRNKSIAAIKMFRYIYVWDNKTIFGWYWCHLN